jgi:hypothetical protein
MTGVRGIGEREEVTRVVWRGRGIRDIVIFAHYYIKGFFFF